MENKDKKSLTALIDEKIAEKSNKKTAENDKQYNVVNAFSADFFKQVSLKNTSSTDLNSAEIKRDAERFDAENLTIQDVGKITDLKTIQKDETIPCQPSVLETPNYDFIQESAVNSNAKQKSKTKRKFRAKLAIITYSIIFLICASWTVANEINLSNTARDITDYQINIIQYVIKIEQTDSVKEGDNSLINNIVEINPPALIQPTQVQPQTNWFDRFCSWLAGLFK